MKFLYGSELTQRIKELCRIEGRIDLAIAYWGSQALELLPLEPGRTNIRIVCCLSGGKSAPEVIKQFGERARQCDNIHAKVIWTSKGAIVSSANASSNGLPEEESLASSLLEAGVFVDDQTELDQIETWFERLFKTGSERIDDLDLRAAAAARPPGGKSPIRKPSLLEFVISNRGRVPPQVSIALAMYKEPASKEQKRVASETLRDKVQAERIKKFLNIGDDVFDKLDWYINWPELPPDHFLIDCHIGEERMKVGHFFHTFSSVKGWKAKVGLPSDHFYFVWDRGSKGPHCVLTKDDKKALENCRAELWDAAKDKSDDSARLLSLTDAAPILFEDAKRRHRPDS
ncbi:phospholipase D family protein [Bradyrhizobium sp. 482_C4_N1_1]|uniref:phospholipase D family protein n=1 Tax=unclassified Bradyrhizobium TaxID=2631580 RepID=UPI003F8B391F